MKSWVVWVSLKVAVMTVSSIFSLIFILSVLLADVCVGSATVGGEFVGVAGNAVGVGGTAVGATVGGGFVGVAGSAVGVGGTVVGGGLVGTATIMVGVGGTVVDGSDVGVGADAQAAAKTTARMSAII